MLLIEKCACAVLEDVSFHLEGNVISGPEGIAKIFVNDGEQTLVVCSMCSTLF